VFVAAGETESSPIWVAALDGSAPPRRLVDKDGLAAFFGANGDVLFAAREGATHFLYRVKQDGTDLTKLTQVFNIFGISPDGRWASAQQPPNSGTSSSLVSTIGEPPVLVCEACDIAGTFETLGWAPPVSWSRDGKFAYVIFHRSTYAIPLKPGTTLPPVPPGGFRSERDLAAVPGARRVAEASVFTGPDPSVYAFTKVAVQRNIYRVPVP
jgi:hypothetical protein